MSSRSTVLKARLHIADIDRGYYADHILTLARHPSETDERVVVRLLAFMLNADASLAFANGLTHEDEPDLWCKDRTGDVSLWIEVGLPDPKRVRKAAIRARRTMIYSYGGRSAKVWWDANQQKLEAIQNLTIAEVPTSVSQALVAIVQRAMELNCTIQDGQVWIADDKVSVPVTLEMRKGSLSP